MNIYSSVQNTIRTWNLFNLFFFHYSLATSIVNWVNILTELLLCVYVWIHKLRIQLVFDNFLNASNAFKLRTPSTMMRHIRKESKRQIFSCVMIKKLEKNLNAPKFQSGTWISWFRLRVVNQYGLPMGIPDMKIISSCCDFFLSTELKTLILHFRPSLPSHPPPSWSELQTAGF